MQNELNETFKDELVDHQQSLLKSSFSGKDVIEVSEDFCNSIAAELEDVEDGPFKKGKIKEALKFENLKELRKLTVVSGGLLSNEFRAKAWPLLLKVSRDEIVCNELMMKKIPIYFQNTTHKEDSGLQDVFRKRYPLLTDQQQEELQLYLNNLIYSVLQKKNKSYYYQGFQDITRIFLLVTVSQKVPYLAYLCLCKMIESNLDLYMEKMFEKGEDVIHVVFALLEAEDSNLFKKIVVECKCPVAFCIPWVLTWYSYTLPNDTDVFRLFDFILGSQEKLSRPYLIPIFLSAALVLHNSRKLILDSSLTRNGLMFRRLSKLPLELYSLEPWLEESLKLMKKYRGKEEKLIKKGIEIKAFQNRLWSEDDSNRPQTSSEIITPCFTFFPKL